MNINNAYLILLISVFLSGCTCGTGRTLIKQDYLTSASSKINQSYTAIELGMTKEKVKEAWGKPDLPGKDLWIYSNDKATPYVKNAIEYDIYFENNKVVNIVEKSLGESKFGCSQLDL